MNPTSPIQPNSGQLDVSVALDRTDTNRMTIQSQDGVFDSSDELIFSSRATTPISFRPAQIDQTRFFPTYFVLERRQLEGLPMTSLCHIGRAVELAKLGMDFESRLAAHAAVESAIECSGGQLTAEQEDNFRSLYRGLQTLSTAHRGEWPNLNRR